MARLTALAPVKFSKENFAVEPSDAIAAQRIRNFATLVITLATSGEKPSAIARTLDVSIGLVTRTLENARAAGEYGDVMNRLLGEVAPLAVDRVIREITDKKNGKVGADVAIKTLEGLGNFKNHKSVEGHMTTKITQLVVQYQMPQGAVPELNAANMVGRPRGAAGEDVIDVEPER